MNDKEIKETFIVPIGDWSGDGHGKQENFTVVANKTKTEIIEAYHKSAKLLNMSFDTNDMMESNPIRLFDDYEDDRIHVDIIKKLEEHGLDIDELTFVDWDDSYYYFCPEDVCILFMEFIKISLSDLEYELREQKNNYLFGYWGDLNISVGYGCFD